MSGSLENRVTEYVDHLHEHFVDPCRVDNGHYLLLTQPGYGAEMTAETIAIYAYPAGTYWASVGAESTDGSASRSTALISAGCAAAYSSTPSR